MKKIVRDCLLTEIEKMVAVQAKKYKITKRCEEPDPEVKTIESYGETLHITLCENKDSLRYFFISLQYPPLRKKLTDQTILRDYNSPRQIRLHRMSLAQDQFETVLESSPNLTPPTRAFIEFDPSFHNKADAFYMLPMHLYQNESPLQSTQDEPYQLLPRISVLKNLKWNRIFYEFPALAHILHVNPNLLIVCQPAVAPPMTKPVPILVQGIRNETKLSDQLIQEGLSQINGPLEMHIQVQDHPPANFLCFGSMVWRSEDQQASCYYQYQDLKYMLEAYLAGFIMIKRVENDAPRVTVYIDRETLEAYGNSFHMNYALQLLAARLAGIDLTYVQHDLNDRLYTDFCKMVQSEVNTLMNRGDNVQIILQKMIHLQDRLLNSEELEGGKYWRPMPL